jgi:hypothetical protein
MSLNNHQPKEYSPEILSGLEAVYSDVWNLLQAHSLTRNEETTRELEITLSQTLAGLATDGVTDPQELRRRAFEAMALTI